MASLHQFLLSISIFFFFFVNGSCSSKSPPLSFSCGNGVEFGYPFWQQPQKTVHYGYPSYGISCINTTPIIHLDNHMYHVKSVNVTRKTLVVSFYELGDTICPVVSHDVGISNSFLNYSNNVKMIHLLYNCTVYPSGVEPIKCLQIGAKHAYAFMEGSIPMFDWKGYCEYMVTTPIMAKSINGSLITSFGKALKEGFELKWSPNLECGSCEAGGGFCEYDADTKQMLSCSCGKGRYYAKCHGQGFVSSNFKLGLLSIGLLICGLTITGTILCIVKKTKDGVYKQGFNPLPTSGK